MPYFPTQKYSVLGRELISSVASVVGLTASHIPPADKNVAFAIIQAISNPIRLCIDGTTAEAAVGIIIVANDFWTVWGYDALVNCSIIDDGTTTATVEVIYYGRK